MDPSDSEFDECFLSVKNMARFLDVHQDWSPTFDEDGKIDGVVNANLLAFEELQSRGVKV